LNSVILITGASKGIGAAFARRVASKNTKLILQYRSNEERIEILSRECTEQGAEVHLIFGDFSTKESTLLFLKEALAFAPDTLVLSHGPYKIQSFDEFSYEDLLSTFQENVFSQIQISQALLSSIKERKGKIIFLGMTNLLGGSLQAPNYLSAKTALSSYTRSLAKYLAPHKASVNMLCPGYCKNSVTHPQNIDAIPMKQEASVEEVAEALYLLFKAPNYQTGNCIEFSGGWHL